MSSDVSYRTPLRTRLQTSRMRRITWPIMRYLSLFIIMVETIQQ